MQKLINKFYPADVIAIIVIIGGLILVWNKVDTITGALLSSVVFYYFGKQKRDHVVLTEGQKVEEK